MPILRISVATCSRPPLMAFLLQQALEHPATREGIVQAQLVDPAHQGQVDVTDAARQIVDAATADAEDRRLSAHRQIVVPVDHRLALRSPALPSAPDNRSFSSASCPILA